MTHLLLFTAFVLWYSNFEAKDDAQEIAAHLTIDHVYQWLQRAVVFGCVWYLLWVLAAKPSTWPILIGHAFLFSAVFRWRLNRLRGMHWAYIAPWSNVYDRVWYCVLVFTKSFGWWPDKEWTDDLEKYYHTKEAIVTIKNVHQSGRLAYGFEITLFALGTAGAVVMLTPA